MSDKKQIDISVVVPIYNIEEEYFRAFLNSLVKQTKKNLEVILVDDASTNNSGEIADEYADKYDYIQCYHIKNRGVGHARNFGVKKAKGKYIAFADPDDVLASDIYEKLFLTAERDGSDLAICDARRFNSQKSFGSNLHLFTFKDLNSISHITSNPGLLYDTTVWNKLISRKLWKKKHIKFPENLLYEDIPVAISLNYYANQVSVIREIGYKWRIREAGESSITQGVKTIKNLSDRISILEGLDKFFKKHVKEESLHFEKDVRILTFDLMIFINTCLEVEKSRAEEVMKIMREYVSDLKKRRAYETLNTVEKALYQALLDNDYERFIKIANFRKNVLPKLPYYENGQRVFVKIPAELFGEESCDITNKVQRSVPKILISKFEAIAPELKLFITLYLPKTNIKDESEQHINAVLINERTGKETPLEAQTFKNSEFTDRKGAWECEETGEKGCYNYDGTGFCITLNADELNLKKTAKDLIIAVRYENRFIKGCASIKNLAKYVKEL